MKKTFKTIMTSLLVGFVMLVNCTNVTFANEERKTVTFQLSQDLIDVGYRIICNTNDVNYKKCTYNGNTSVGVELYLNDNNRVAAFPAVNNGKDYAPQDVEFRVNDALVSRPNPDQGYRPWVLYPFNEWEAGTTFVAYKRTSTISYFDGSALLQEEKIIAGENASGFIPENTETETEVRTFEKWIDATGNDANLNAVQLSMSVYAKYTVESKHLVNFLVDDEAVASTRVLNGTSASNDTIPTKDSVITEDEDNTYTTAYTFAYWEANGNEVKLDSYLINEDTTFTAVFNEATSTAAKVLTPANPVVPVTPIVPADPTPVDPTPIVPADPTPIVPGPIAPTPIVPADPTPIVPGPIVPGPIVTTPGTPVENAFNRNANEAATIPTAEAVATPEAQGTAVPAATAIALQNATTVAQTQLETINEDATPLNDGLNQQETITETDTPLAKPISITSTWSLMNLILMAATILLGLYAFMKNKKYVSTVFNKTFATIVFVASIATFFLTQDVMSVMSFVDGWTAVMAIMLVVQCAVVFIRKQATEEE